MSVTGTDHSAALAWFLRTLADVPDGDAVAQAVASGLLSSCEPLSVTLYALSRDRACLERLGEHGLDPTFAHEYQRIPVDTTTVMGDCFRTGSEMLMSFEESDERYPLSASYRQTHAIPAGAQTLHLPLRHRGAVIGVLGAVLGRAVDRSWSMRKLLDATQASLALWVMAHGAYYRDAGSTSGGRRLTLTERQHEILRMARSGRTNGDIARSLGYSEVTIKSDLTTLYKLLGAHGRDDLLARAARSGL